MFEVLSAPTDVAVWLILGDVKDRQLLACQDLGKKEDITAGEEALEGVGLAEEADELAAPACRDTPSGINSTCAARRAFMPRSRTNGLGSNARVHNASTKERYNPPPTRAASADAKTPPPENEED